MGVPPAYPLVWHAAQSTVLWAPVNGNTVVVLWLNVELVQSVGVWHKAQSVGKAELTWFGLVVELKFDW